MISATKSLPLLTAAAATLLCGACSGESPSAGTSPERVYKVEAARAGAEDVRVTLRAVGIVHASKKAEIDPQVDGLVAEIFYKQGSDVEQGDLLIRLDDRKAAAKLALSEATLDNAKAELRVAEQRMVRNRRLIAEELVSQDEFDSVEAGLLAAAASVREQEASVTLAARELDDYHISAPFSGIVGERLVDVGNYVERGTALVVLMKIDPIEIEFKVPDRHAEALNTTTRVTVSSSAGGAPYEGTISFIDPRVDRDTRMLSLRANVPNPNGTLRDGQFVEVSALLGVRESQVVVPEEAILLTEGKTWVYIIDDGHAYRREVHLGERLSPLVEILSGIDANAHLVVGGQHRLSDGSRVEVLDAAPRDGA